MLKEIKAISENEFELIRITLRVLDKFRKFDTLKIYETDKHFEIHTVCHSKKYVTRTFINKMFWRVDECYCQVAGEKETKLK